MRSTQHSTEVCIVGAGPTGLMLGAFLGKLGVDFLLIEQHPDRHNHSRSLGIHPPSISLFEELGLIDQLFVEAVKIRRGHAFDDNGKIGTLDFDILDIPHPYILSLPQYRTESILENHLPDDAILKGFAFSRYVKSGGRIISDFTSGDVEMSVSSRYLVGADGKNSQVRKSAGIAFNGREYPDVYMMGDFEDSTSLGDDAGIFLCRDGLVECFPLGENGRRWVARTTTYQHTPSARQLAATVLARTGSSIDPGSCSMISSFGVQGFIAERFVKENVILAGDAAHVVSPIGGQGMNLGWLDARLLAECLAHSENLQLYEVHRRISARKALRRAEFNMRMGRQTRLPLLKRLAARTLLVAPINKTLAELFTMRGL